MTVAIEITGSVPEEVLNNLHTLLSTRTGTAALDRAFGIDQDFLDMPIAAAQSALTAEITAKIHKYEPRAKLVSLTLETSPLSGQMNAKAVIALNE